MAPGGAGNGTAPGVAGWVERSEVEVTVASSAPATAGEGTTGAREASEPWWRGRLTRRFVDVEEQARVLRKIYDACVALSPAPPPPPCFAGWSPSPAIAVADVESVARIE